MTELYLNLLQSGRGKRWLPRIGPIASERERAAIHLSLPYPDTSGPIYRDSE